MKTCPYCAEQIQNAAVKCRFCGEMLVLGDAHSAPVASPWAGEAPRPASAVVAPPSRKRSWVLPLLTFLVVLGGAAALVYYALGRDLGLLDTRKDQPRIDVQCTMNGLGAGSCDFTNTGTASGSVCGRVVVKSNKMNGSKESGKFCSGEVMPRSTKNVTFTIVGIPDMCFDTSQPSVKWTENCDLEFEESR